MRTGVPLMLLLAMAGGGVGPPHPEPPPDPRPAFVPDTVVVRDERALAQLGERLGGPVDREQIVVAFVPNMPRNMAALYRREQLEAALPKLIGLLLTGDADPGIRMILRMIELPG